MLLALARVNTTMMRTEMGMLIIRNKIRDDINDSK